MPSNRENVSTIRNCLGHIEGQLDALIENLKDHRRETREDVKVLHARIDSKTSMLQKALKESVESREQALEKVSARLSDIERRHLQEDGIGRVKSTVGGAIVAILSGMAGAALALLARVFNAFQ